MKAMLPMILVALTACAAGPPAISPRAGTTAGFGETARLGALAVRPIALVEDSRCPVDVQCVWEGRLVISADIVRGVRREQAMMTLGQPLHLDGNRLILVAAVPERRGAVPLAMGDYRLTFAVEDNP